MKFVQNVALYCKILHIAVLHTANVLHNAAVPRSDFQYSLCCIVPHKPNYRSFAVLFSIYAKPSNTEVHCIPTLIIEFVVFGVCSIASRRRIAILQVAVSADLPYCKSAVTVSAVCSYRNLEYFAVCSTAE